MIQTSINFDLLAQRHSPTSVAAAEAIQPCSANLRGKVLAFLREHGGATDEEGIEATGISPSTYRPRRIELVRSGAVADSGTTRRTAAGRNAVIWIAVQQLARNEGTNANGTHQDHQA